MFTHDTNDSPVTVLRLDSVCLDQAIAKRFFYELDEHISMKPTILDLSNVRFVDSVGLWSLTRCRKKWHGRIYLTGVTHVLKKYLETIPAHLLPPGVDQLHHSNIVLPDDNFEPSAQRGFD